MTKKSNIICSNYGSVIKKMGRTGGVCADCSAWNIIEEEVINASKIQVSRDGQVQKMKQLDS